jgi:peptidoglycan/xylan/chitin deacetylase (PgdA/CDA1 family)
MRLLLFLSLSLSLSVSLSAANDPSRRPAVKQIALSFDDAPRGDGAMFDGEQRTTALINALRAAKVGPVVFFVKTAHLERPGGVARIERYAKAGHLIANHTHSHAWLSRTDTDEYIEDIDKAELLLAAFSNRRAWFRFPYLDEGKPISKRNAVRAALRERGLMNGYVTVDNYDWYLEQMWRDAVNAGRDVNMNALGDTYVELLLGAVAFYDNIATDTIGRSPAHILLLHENDLAAMFIGDLVAALRGNGWTIISPDEAYKDPINTVIPTTLITRQGHVAALAIDAGLDPRTLTHLAIEEDQIEAMLLDRAVFGQSE